MRRASSPRLAILLLGLLPLVGRAQTGPAPHPIGAAVATSSVALSAAFLRAPVIVSQSDGRVFLADGGARVVWHLDASLGNAKVVLDSALGRSNSFSANSFLMPFRGDSALFFDRGAGVLVAIAPDGSLGRTFAPPSGPGGFGTRFGPGMSSSLISGGASIMPAINESAPLGVSPALGLVYKISANAPPVAPRPVRGEPANILIYEDSTQIMRWDYDSRRIDSVAKLSTGRVYRRIVSVDSSRQASMRNLFVFYDDAVVTTDGSIALFHGREYRFDWVTPDGKIVRGQRTPFAWRRISDDDRARIADSINTLDRQRVDSALARRAADSARTGSPPMSTIYSSVDGVMVPRQVPQQPPPLPTPITLEEIPDFYPPTPRAALLADADNRIWIRQMPVGGDRTAPVLWDIVDRQGTIVDRVTIPIEQTLIGFAPGGFVFTVVSDAGKLTLTKRRVK